jgi:peptidoglycan/LPS O-acetylase OafA/YrhL
VFTSLLVLTTFYLIVSIIYFGRKFPMYSHVRDTISELGEKGSLLERTVAYKVFLLVGFILILSAGALYFQDLRTNTQLNLCGLLACVGVGYVIAAFFPCDPGSPLTGSTRQSIHNFGGVIGYIGGAYFLIKTSLPIFPILGYLIISCSVAMSFSSLSSWRGFIQRVARSRIVCRYHFFEHPGPLIKSGATTFSCSAT